MHLRSREGVLMRVHVYTNDSDEDGQYTYAVKATAKYKDQVIDAIKIALDGFKRVKVVYLYGNVYKLTHMGPDEYSSEEMRNLVQMGEFTDFTIRDDLQKKRSDS